MSRVEQLEESYTAELSELREAQSQLQGELVRVRGEYDDRLAGAISQALEDQATEHETTLAMLRKERDSLQATVADLKDAAGAAGEARAVEPYSLVDKFASVLEQMADRSPPADREYTASLTSLQVEARGILRAPTEVDAAPQFVTVAPGAVDPAQLSTMRMEFRMTPIVGPEKSREI
jgi:chromosome segregation ATPase